MNVEPQSGIIMVSDSSKKHEDRRKIVLIDESFSYRRQFMDEVSECEGLD